MFLKTVSSGVEVVSGTKGRGGRSLTDFSQSRLVKPSGNVYRCDIFKKLLSDCNFNLKLKVAQAKKSRSYAGFELAFLGLMSRSTEFDSVSLSIAVVTALRAKKNLTDTAVCVFFLLC